MRVRLHEMEGRGRGMAPRGVAWLMAQPHRWKKKRGIPRPLRSVGRQQAHGGMFHPLGAGIASGVQAMAVRAMVPGDPPGLVRIRARLSPGLSLPIL